MKKTFKYFTIPEICLWAAMMCAVVTVFCIFPEKNYISLVSALICVTGLAFISKGYIVGQAICVVFSVFYGIVSFYLRYYGEMITYLGMTAPMAILTLIMWIKNRFGKTAVVSINRTTKKHFIILFAATVPVTVAFYFILRALGNANLIISTVSVATSFFAAGFIFLRSPFYGLAYAANDAVLIVLWSLAAADNLSYLTMVVNFCACFIYDIYGFFSWRLIKNRQSAPPNTEVKE